MKRWSWEVFSFLLHACQIEQYFENVNFLWNSKYWRIESPWVLTSSCVHFENIWEVIKSDHIIYQLIMWYQAAIFGHWSVVISNKRYQTIFDQTFFCLQIGPREGLRKTVHAWCEDGKWIEQIFAYPERNKKLDLNWFSNVRYVFGWLVQPHTGAFLDAAFVQFLWV